MLIVLVSLEDQNITICGKTTKVFSWEDIDSFRKILSGKDVYYITSAEEVSGEEIVSMIEDSIEDTQEIPSNIKKKTEKPYESKYIHPTRSGIVVCNHRDIGKDPITFDGYNDFMKIENLKDLLLEFPSIKMYLQNGVLEAINESQKKTVQAQVAKNNITRRQKARQAYGLSKKVKNNKSDSIGKRARKSGGIIQMSEDEDEIEDINSIDLTNEEENRNNDINVDENQMENLESL